MVGLVINPGAFPSTRILQNTAGERRVILPEFEEKTYEHYLISELVGNRLLFFPPGQCLEGILGFDVALRTTNRSFWRNFFGLFNYPPGITLSREWWQELEAKIEYFPKFKFNCFIQAKRPDYMTRSTSAEYSSWNMPYFRYNTFISQQKALEFLAQKTSGKSIVTYACPAFHKYKELYGFKKGELLVQNSNFCEVIKLNSHNRYSFANPGNKGIAHSDPEPVESMPFEQSLNELGNQEPTRSNVTFLAGTAELTHSAAEQLGTLYEPYSFIERTLSEAVTEMGPLAKSLARISSFLLVCNVKLMIGY